MAWCLLHAGNEPDSVGGETRDNHVKVVLFIKGYKELMVQRQGSEIVVVLGK